MRWREVTTVQDARSRVVINAVSPEIECARFRAKRTVGEQLTVTADVFTDGHDHVAAVVRYRPAGTETWHETTMVAVPNVPDRFAGSFEVDRVGRYEYTLRAWVDRFGTWHSDLAKKVAADVDVTVDLLAGAELVEAAVKNATGDSAEELDRIATTLRDESAPLDRRIDVALADDTAELVAANDERRFATDYGRVLELHVDRERARYSTWYELFPRSASPDPDRPGTLRDVIDRLPYVAGLGFDVLYLPPIHPIGEVNRKGPNNAVTAEPGDVGSPWAIGSEDGGHKSVHPDLGTIEDLEALVAEAADHGIEIALDIALQCAPDHPYVREHPEWFKKRPDGTIQYAENPPKKYQDIYPFDFECDAWESLWAELKSIFDFWIGHGIRIFRVDNPHTKSLPFWEWCIEQITAEHPDIIFLSEAFTRRSLMYGLAKRGFTQSYTYFAWRTRKWELEEYFTELTGTEVADYFRPSAWPNTPDILTEFLQYGGRPAYVQRLVLAATLSANYGIYGPAFELMQSEAREPGSEEYLDSEKYEVRHWDLDREDSLAPLIARLNRIRRDNPALHSDRSLLFHRVDNDELLCYSKVSDNGSNVILVVVNVDPHWKQAGWLHLDLAALGLRTDQGYQVHDLLGGARYLWHGPDNYVELDPNVLPAHVFTLRRHERTERDFAYFL
ncbi:MAG: alpha-1,4-glucan--maltose-1-phosphate maltosyltransferase [Actinobacteria bacterium]|nr:alpha-1,4-glucan--maltose-1-phosphate maltosyltransferase [Actinomycetota bacterium]